MKVYSNRKMLAYNGRKIQNQFLSHKGHCDHHSRGEKNTLNPIPVQQSVKVLAKQATSIRNRG